MSLQQVSPDLVVGDTCNHANEVVSAWPTLIPYKHEEDSFGPPTLERSSSEQRWKALKALNPLLTAFRKSRPKVKAACNDANTTQNDIHSFHNYFFFKMLSANSAKKIVENNPTPNSKA